MNPDIPENKRRELLELIGQGRKIDAVKVYREVTGLGLKEAKDAVEAMGFAPQYPLSGGLRNPPPPAGASPSTLSNLSSAQQGSIRELIRQNRKIEAIKLYREATGLGLKESKDAVEAMETSVPAPEGRLPRPHFDPFDEKNKGCFGMVAMLCAAALLMTIFGVMR